MTHEQLVPTLETCIHAKDVGYLQGKSHFVWLREKGGMWKLVSNKVLYLAAETVDAPTLQELLEELRGNFPNLEFELTTRKDPKEPFGLTVYNGLIMLTKIKSFNPAEAAALLWLKLHKHKEVA